MKKIYIQPQIVVETSCLYSVMASESEVLEKSSNSSNGIIKGVYSKEASWDDEEDDEY